MPKATIFMPRRQLSLGGDMPRRQLSFGGDKQTRQVHKTALHTHLLIKGGGLKFKFQIIANLGSANVKT